MPLPRAPPLANPPRALPKTDYAPRFNRHLKTILPLRCPLIRRLACPTFAHGAGGAAPRNLVSPLRGGFTPKIPTLGYRPTFAPISPQKNQALFLLKLVYRPLTPSKTLKNTKIPSQRPFSISSKPAQNISDHFRLIMLLFDT